MHVKICGLTTPESVALAADAGAHYIGFMFFKNSPRNLEIPAAAALAITVPEGVAKVAVTVNATDAELDAITEKVPLDILQLHGQETPSRVADIRARYGIPVMKVVGIADVSDLAALDNYNTVADQILVETKARRDAVLPGGNGIPFDWRLVANHRWTVPWMLAGGLTPENVAKAIQLTGATQVDVSSGVESAPGLKDPDLIKAFIAAAG